MLSANYRMPVSYKTLNEALELIKESVRDEREDELFYDYLASIAPSCEEKEIIESIRNDERKHNMMFRYIYGSLTGMEIQSPENVEFEKPRSYVAGIKKAFFGELSAVERYRTVRAGLPNRYFRDMVFEILTDELKHADKYNYILGLYSEHVHHREDYDERGPVIRPKTGFTAAEAAQIARELGIDFSKEKFDLEQFRKGLDVELEHGRRDQFTNVTGDNPILTGKIALAHLREFPDYYTRLAKLEAEAKAYWGTR